MFLWAVWLVCLLCGLLCVHLPGQLQGCTHGAICDCCSAYLSGCSRILAEIGVALPAQWYCGAADGPLRTGLPDWLRLRTSFLGLHLRRLADHPHLADPKCAGHHGQGQHLRGDLDASLPQHRAHKGRRHGTRANLHCHPAVDAQSVFLSNWTSRREGMLILPAGCEQDPLDRGYCSKCHSGGRLLHHGLYAPHRGAWSSVSSGGRDTTRAPQHPVTTHIVDCQWNQQWSGRGIRGNGSQHGFRLGGDSLDLAHGKHSHLQSVWWVLSSILYGSL